ncbi:MAG: OmpH family outer membrane protein [Bacteroidales bacterium]|nr:OmpH family outer membrane protein [Bacteroidales bacterium]
MKKTIFIITVIVAFAFTGNAQKFAFVDTKYILENIPEYKAAQEQLDELSMKWQKELEEKFAEIDKLYKDFQAESVLLPADMKKKKEDEIVKKEKDAKDLQKKRFGKDGDLFKKREELVKPIQDRVYNAVETIASSGNYGIIFDQAGSLTMLYVDLKLDKSDEVLQKMGVVPTSDKQKDKDKKGKK